LTGSDQHDEQLGPIDFIAVAFPGGRPDTAGFQHLLDLVDRDVISILDTEFLTKDADGTTRIVTASEITSADLSAWQGASSQLLDSADLEQVGAGLEPGDLAVVVVFENRWVTGLVDAFRTTGARLIAEGGIPAADLVDALDATDLS